MVYRVRMYKFGEYEPFQDFPLRDRTYPILGIHQVVKSMLVSQQSINESTNQMHLHYPAILPFGRLAPTVIVATGWQKSRFSSQAFPLPEVFFANERLSEVPLADVRPPNMQRYRVRRLDTPRFLLLVLERQLRRSVCCCVDGVGRRVIGGWERGGGTRNNYNTGTSHSY